jgi:hypothetical protein
MHSRILLMFDVVLQPITSTVFYEPCLLFICGRNNLAESLFEGGDDSEEDEGVDQGDQIGPIFVQWVIAIFWQFYDIYRGRRICLGYFFPWQTLYVNFGKKGWATFWATFHTLIW